MYISITSVLVSRFLQFCLMYLLNSFTCLVLLLQYRNFNFVEGLLYFDFNIKVKLQHLLFSWLSSSHLSLEELQLRYHKPRCQLSLVILLAIPMCFVTVAISLWKNLDQKVNQNGAVQTLFYCKFNEKLLLVSICFRPTKSWKVFFDHRRGWFFGSTGHTLCSSCRSLQSYCFLCDFRCVDWIVFANCS